jgi:hypothetical protein
MSEWESITIRKEVKKQAERNKEQGETWSEYIKRCCLDEDDFVKVEDLRVNERKLYRKLDNLEKELKEKIEQETCR